MSLQLTFKTMPTFHILAAKNVYPASNIEGKEKGNWLQNKAHRLQDKALWLQRSGGRCAHKASTFTWVPPAETHDMSMEVMYVVDRRSCCN